MADTPPICVRMAPQLVRRVDAAARCHGWTRTTWILRAIGKALDADEAVYGPTPDQVARAVKQRADAVERNRRWRRTGSGRRPPSGNAST